MPVVTHTSHLEFERKHPRGKDGRFIRNGAAVKLTGAGGNFTVQGIELDGKVRIKSTSGATQTVDAKQLSTATPKIPSAVYTEEAGASHVASLGQARANWLKRVAQGVVANADPNDPELPYWRGVLGGTAASAPAPTPPQPKPISEDDVDAKVERMGWYSSGLREKYRQSVALASPYGGTPENPKRVTLDGQTFEVWTDPQAAAEAAFNGAQGYDYATRLRYPDGHVESLEQSHDVEYAIADELGRTLARRALEQAQPKPQEKPPPKQKAPKWQALPVPQMVGGQMTKIRARYALRDPDGNDLGQIQQVQEFMNADPSKPYVTGKVSVGIHWEARDAKGNKLGYTYGTRKEAETAVRAAAGIQPAANPSPAPNSQSSRPSFQPKKLADLRDARAYYEELRARVEANYPLDDLDPRGRQLPEGHKAGHARELLFDMARGRNRVPHVTAVSNEEYRQKLAVEGKLPDFEAFVQEQPWILKKRVYGFQDFKSDPMLRFFGKGYLQRVQVTLPPDTDHATLIKARAALASGFNTKDIDDYLATLKPGEQPRFLDYLKHSKVVPYKTDITFLEEERRAQAQRKYDARVNTIINRERKKDGTHAVEFKDIPHWANVRLEDQTWEDVRAHMETAAPGSFVPTFHESGVVTDGVLYHRGRRGAKEPSHETAMRAARGALAERLGNYPPTSYDLFVDGEPTAHHDLTEMIDAAESPSDLKDIMASVTSKYKYSSLNDVPGKPFEKPPLEIDQHWAPSGGQDAVTTGRVHVDADRVTIDALTAAGAVAAVNSKNIDPGYKGRGKIYAGRMLIMTEGERPESDLDALISAKRQLKQRMKQFAKSHNLPPTFDFSEIDAAKNWDDTQAAETKFRQWVNANGLSSLTYNAPIQEMFAQAGERSVPQIRAAKRIEYVPHDQAWDIDAATDQQRTDAFREAALGVMQAEFQDTLGYPLNDVLKGMDAVHAAKSPQEVMTALTALMPNHPNITSTDVYYARSRAVSSGQEAIRQLPTKSLLNKKGSPTNQRGRLTVEGYSPEEAVAKLRELGLVGELDSAVPYSQVMRSNRREGLVLPLHRDYVNGDAPLPKIHHLLTHGITGGGWQPGDQEKIERSIFGGGGLHSIAERFKRGIKAQTTSPAGDIRSGIDHVVFIGHDSGHAVGSGAAYRIGLKPEAYLRRDIAMAPKDFGGMDTRYEEYKRYLNGLQRRAKETETSLYASPSPRVRQYHINAKKSNPGSAEFNIGGSIPVEDMAVVSVKDQAAAARLDKLLDQMLAEGKITSKPRVVTGGQEFTEATTVE